jgi:hypothetical protein
MYGVLKALSDGASQSGGRGRIGGRQMSAHAIFQPLRDSARGKSGGR